MDDFFNTRPLTGVTSMAKKYVDESWDFGAADTKTYTHCSHSYPAMMIPRVAGRLIDKYGWEY